jgi:hypothetical protein
VLSVILVLGVVISDQQLLGYEKQHQVFAKINAAGPEGREAVCRNLRLPWFARQFDVLTPAAMMALLLIAGILILRKKLKISKTIIRVALSVFIIGTTIIFIYQFVDPFFPFSLCRGLLP